MEKREKEEKFKKNYRLGWKMKIAKGGIAFFDSGIGGLTVLSACREYLPNELFYYYGDNHHAPYGNLPPNKIRRYVRRAFRLFARLKVRAVVVACNTATALCIEELRKRYAFPIIGTEPAVFAAARLGGIAYVLTTRATYESARFKKLCNEAEKQYPHAKLIPIPCDNLAGEIERRLGEEGYDFTPFLPKGNPDVVVLGCTHYIYIEEVVGEFYHCPVVHGNDGIAFRLYNILSKMEKSTTQPSKSVCNRESRPYLTTPCERGVFFPQKRALYPNIATKNGEVIFLGKCKVVNKIQYEQMFARENRLKAGRSGQKKQKN